MFNGLSFIIFFYICIYFLIFSARKTYNPSSKNGLKTRGIKGYQGLSLKPDHITLLSSLGKQEELCVFAEKMAVSGSKRVKLVPASNKKQTLFHQHHFVFNISDELAYKYSISNICDKSNDPTSIRTWEGNFL